MRQAAKNEHHRYQYNENTGEVYNKGNIEDLVHMKGMPEKDFVFELFLKKELQAYMHKNYQIVPVLFNKKRIRKVSHHQYM
jgi:hypothetical protein